jgi:Raf kinase inhibitor-like YbhB/YbcL family protein
MRQVDVERRRIGRAALAPGLVLIFATIAGCTSSGAVTSATSEASTAPGASSLAPSGSPSNVPPTEQEESAMASAPSPSTTTFALSSPAFDEGRPIPREYTCRGEDVSPELEWRGVPSGAGALVLFVDDPDGRDWVHWIVLDLPASDGKLAKGIDPSADRARQGKNDFGKVGYGGPCPPSGTHHYRFTLYALAAPLGLSGHPDGSAVRRALEGATVLGHVRLTGTFQA